MHLFVVIISIVFYAKTTLAQAVTAPFSVSQRLLNPAAAVTRSYRSFALGLESNIEKSNVLGLQNSSISEEIKIDQALIHGAWLVWSNWFIELDIAFQAGVKKKANIFNGEETNSSQTNEDALNLIPVQILAGRKVTSKLNIGLKALTTMAKVDTSNNYRSGYSGNTTTVVERNKLEAKLIVLGVGFTYNLAPNFVVGYSADFNQFRFVRDITGNSSTVTSGNSVNSQSNNIQSTTSTIVRRDIFGFGIFSGNPKNTAFRSEFSMERIAPLEERDGLKEGVLTRASIEGQWSFAHIGVEYTLRQGYMIDSYNLIPYFFKFEKFSNITVTDYGFFGGFKTSKGHSIGGSFSLSSQTVKEKLSSSDLNTYDVERKSQTLGLSYSYVF